MIVSQAIALLVETELKQLKVKTDKTAIRGFINSAIIELHKRFRLWEVRAIITMVEGTTLYTMVEADSNVAIDLSDHEFLMIEEVWLISDDVQIDDTQLTLNHLHDPTGVSIPKFNQVEVHTVLDARELRVIYRATSLPLTNEKAEIPLPPIYQEALFHYVGYRAHGGNKGGIKDENNTHYQRFTASCNRIKTDGLYNQEDLESDKFEIRGFV